MTPSPNDRDGYSEPRSPLGHVEEWESSAVDYLEARLSAVQSSGIAGHLASCASCREKLAEQKRMIAFLGAVEPVDVPGDLESRVFDRLFLVSSPLSPTRRTEPGVLRRLLTGATRRPWVPAVIAAVAVMVALAGSGGVIRSGGGAPTARSDLDYQTAAGAATTVGAQTQALKSAPSPTAGASLLKEEGRDDAGNTVATLDLPGTATTVMGPIQDSPPQTNVGDAGATATTVRAATGDIAAVSETDAYGGGPAKAAAQYAAPTIWVTVQVASGDVNAGYRIEEITGLSPLSIRAAPGVPIYAAKIRRGSVDAILRQLSDAGLTVGLSEDPQPPLDPASTLETRDISALPYLEPVSPQGDTLSGSSATRVVDAETDYVLIVLAAVR